jgi:hypothetical protein
VRSYDPESMMVVVFNMREGNHTSYLMRLPVTAAEVEQAIAEQTLADEGQRLMDRLRGA